jgi:hypothetical protein
LEGASRLHIPERFRVYASAMPFLIRHAHWHQGFRSNGSHQSRNVWLGVTAVHSRASAENTAKRHLQKSLSSLYPNSDNSFDTT